MACHAHQNFTEPNKSAFILYDGQRLTLDDLAAVRLAHADLANLSACQTATGDIKLVDEALHLAAGMQLSGYRHVLATLWNIYDASGPSMAAAIYRYLVATGQPDSTRTAYALHCAVTGLKNHDPGDPMNWAPYIHFGP